MANKGIYDFKTGEYASADTGLGNLLYSSPTDAYMPSINQPYTNMYTKAQLPSISGVENVTLPETSSIFGKDGFGWNQGTLKGLGTIGNLASGLGSLYTGYKQMGLAEDTFAFNKDMANKEYAMAKDAYDKQVARAANVGSQMNAGKVG